MAGFRNIKSFVEGQVNYGRTHGCTFRKVPSQASTALNWVDLSMAAGNPPANFYAASPLESDTLDKFKGIFHGDDKSPSTKFLTSMSLTTASSALLGRYILCDYVMYYPFIDGDSTDQQDMIQTVTLQRYTNGDGLRLMMVCVAPTLGGGSFTFNYVNQNGESKTSATISCNTAVTNIGSIATSEQATAAGGLYFLPFAAGDTGIRQLTSVTFISPSGGLFAFVIVKPLYDTVIREINTSNEEYLICQKTPLPKIEDGAYLNFIANPAASVAAAVLTGNANFAWSD
jgi:hypothetical protein